MDAKEFLPVEAARGTDSGTNVPWPSADYNWGNTLTGGTSGTVTEDTRCLLCLGEEQSFEEVFGVTSDQGPGKYLEEGQSVDLTQNMIVAMPAPKEFPGKGRGTFDYPTPANFKPAPLRGSTYGVGVFSTPAAEIESHSLNPISQLGLRDFLTRPQARSMLREVGVTDAEDVEWLQGPEEGVAGAEGPTNINFLGEETELKTFGGVFSGDVGPWSVAVHMARVNVESDIVIGAGVQRTLGAVFAQEPARFAPDDAPDWLRQGQEFTGNVFDRVIGGQPV